MSWQYSSPVICQRGFSRSPSILIFVSIYLKFCVVQLWLHPLSDWLLFLLFCQPWKRIPPKTWELWVTSQLQVMDYGCLTSLSKCLFAVFPQKKRVRVYFCYKNGTQNLKGVPKEHMQSNKNPSRVGEEILVNTAK